MKIAIISAVQAGSLKAATINVTKMAEGFATLGHEVTFISLSKSLRLNKRDLYKLYGIHRNFRWIRLPFLVGGKFLFAILALLIVHKQKPDFIYCRNYAVPWLFIKMGISLVNESHAHPSNRTFWYKRFVSSTHSPNFLGWITINETLVDHYLRAGAAKKFIVLPDAVDPKLFKRHDLQGSKPFAANTNITYAGHLYDYKGIPTILEAAAITTDITYNFIGGLPEDISRHTKTALRMGLSNVCFYGLVPHRDIPVYLWNSDILLLVPSANHPSAKWTSPVKAGEYLYSGVPVIASAIPALKRWFRNGEVYFVAPDDPVELARAIKKILSDTHLTKNLSQAGMKWAEQNTFSQRATDIINYASK